MDPNSLITALWTLVLVLWWIPGFTTKRAIASRSRWRAHAAVWVVGAAWWLLLSRGLWRGPLAWRFLPLTPLGAYIGLAVTTTGLAFSIWARFYLGRNWSAFITVKEDHKLVRSGPYAIVRHPIYSGFMLATLGTAIAYGQVAGLISVALIVGAWGYKSRLEETAMTEQFGQEYERYRREVKGLVPLLW
jgi:protein-S-isoprenylcysteine O-methyltransferase Ste14